MFKRNQVEEAIAIVLEPGVGKAQLRNAHPAEAIT
jgi:hypothetical protein